MFKKYQTEPFETTGIDVFRIFDIMTLGNVHFDKHTLKKIFKTQISFKTKNSKFKFYERIVQSWRTGRNTSYQ